MMHNRRVAALAPIAPQLNPKVYQGVIRQLEFELGETLTEVQLLKQVWQMVATPLAAGVGCPWSQSPSRGAEGMHAGMVVWSR